MAFPTLVAAAGIARFHQRPGHALQCQNLPQLPAERPPDTPVSVPLHQRHTTILQPSRQNLHELHALHNVQGAADAGAVSPDVEPHGYDAKSHGPMMQTRTQGRGNYPQPMRMKLGR